MLTREVGEDVVVQAEGTAGVGNGLTAGESEADAGN